MFLIILMQWRGNRFLELSGSKTILTKTVAPMNVDRVQLKTLQIDPLSWNMTEDH